MPRIRYTKRNSPQTLRARAEFRRRNFQISLGFFQLYDLFASNCTQLSEIADKGGVTVECVRQLRNEIFSPLFAWGTDGRARRRACMVHRGKMRREQAKKPTDPAHLKSLILKLLREGLTVQRIPVGGDILEANFRKTQILVNGRACSVKWSGRSYKRSPHSDRLYWQVPFGSLRECGEFIIHQVWVPHTRARYFVIPTMTLARHYPQEATRNRTFNIPLGGYAVGPRSRAPIIDFWQFHNAFNLLRE